MILNFPCRLAVFVVSTLVSALQAGVFQPVRTGNADPFFNTPVDWDAASSWQAGGPPNSAGGDDVLWDVNRFGNGQLSTVFLHHDAAIRLFTFISTGSELVSSNQLNITSLDWRAGAFVGEGQLHIGGLTIQTNGPDGLPILVYSAASTFTMGQHDLGDWALVNHGQAIWSNGQALNGTVKSVIHNLPYAEFDLQTTANFSADTWYTRFLNEGKVIKSGGGPELYQNYANFEQFENRGSVEVQRG